MQYISLIQTILLLLLADFCFKKLLAKNHLKAAGLFKYVWPFCYHQALQG